MQQGWIKLDRSILDHWVHKDKPFNRFAAWVDLLLMANYEENKVNVGGEFIVLERGQIAVSIRYLSSRWGWSKDKTAYFLSSLEVDGMVTKKCDKNRTVLTVVNYRFYQDLPDKKKTDIGHLSDTERTLVGQESDDNRTPIGQNKQYNNLTNKQDNKETNNNITPLNLPTGAKSVRYFPNDERLEEAFKAFLEMRKKRKNANTDYAIKLLLSKLEKLSTDPDTQVKIIEQSIENGWIGLFELRNNDCKTKTQGIADIWANVH